MNRTKITRRTLMKGAGAGVAAFTFVPRHVLGGPGKEAPSDKLNIAAIGAIRTRAPSCSRKPRSGGRYP